MRTLQTAKASGGKAPRKNPAKQPARKKTSTPKATPVKKGGLVRDLHHAASTIELRALQVIKAAQMLRKDEGWLKKKADEISTSIEEAKKDHDERVGKVEKDIANYQLSKVQQALSKNHKTAIDAAELKTLRDLETAMKDSKVKGKEELQKEVSEKVAGAVRFKEVEFEHKYVEVLAQLAANDAERRTLQVTIAGLRVEIESQKHLSSEIAKANQQIKINTLKRKAIEDQQAKDEAFRSAQQQANLAASGMRGSYQPSEPKPKAPAATAPTPARAPTPTRGKAIATPKKAAVSEEDTLSEDSDEDSLPKKKKESSQGAKPAAKKAAAKKAAAKAG